RVWLEHNSSLLIVACAPLWMMLVWVAYKELRLPFLPLTSTDHCSAVQLEHQRVVCSSSALVLLASEQVVVVLVELH
ncbi:MAG: hypothetical protein ACKPKO_52780, partial [Candidatus Fonsibacter sp.]